jgi:hypothetical protein
MLLVALLKSSLRPKNDKNAEYGDAVLGNLSPKAAFLLGFFHRKSRKIVISDVEIPQFLAFCNVKIS